MPLCEIFFVQQTLLIVHRKLVIGWKLVSIWPFNVALSFVVGVVELTLQAKQMGQVVAFYFLLFLRIALLNMEISLLYTLQWCTVL